MKKHISVLVDETIRYLTPRAGKIYVDATCGSGGHARRILEETAGKCFLICIDKNKDAVERAKENLMDFTGSFVIIQGGFENIDSIVKMTGREKVDGVLFDLGFSTEEIFEKKGGFSFLLEGPLDMRYDRENSLTAERIINYYSSSELIDIFKKYGEIRNPAKIVKKIIERRGKKYFETTTEFADFISRIYRGPHRRIHPATVFFQSIRIAVNDEITNLQEGLQRAWDILNKNGRMLVISFHSLEDREVKIFLREKKEKNEAIILTKKPVTAPDMEIALNPRARSAKMRVGEKP